MEAHEIRRHMTHILTDAGCTVLDGARSYLIPLRGSEMAGWSLTESRCLWYALILYRFREDVSDKVWMAAKGFVLGTLRQEPDLVERARHYLSAFSEWKQADHQSFVHEVVGYYLEVLHLKQTIEESKEEATIVEWKDSYQGLIRRIRDAAERLGFLRLLDERVAEVNRMRHSLVEEMMKRAYWDGVEQDIREERYTSVICQMMELKSLIAGVIPSRYHADLNERFDVEDIQARLETRTMDPDYLVQLCRWVMESMKEWDSAEAQTLYDREIQTWESAMDMEWPRFLRFSLELCTLLALDAKTRVAIWRSLIRST